MIALQALGGLIDTWNSMELDALAATVTLLEPAARKSGGIDFRTGTAADPYTRWITAKAILTYRRKSDCWKSE